MKTPKPGQLKYLDTVRSILMNRLAEYKTEIFLFGSVARGDFRRTSDIDIAVLPQKELPPGLLSELREELDESLIPYRVELIDLSKAPLRFSRRVRKTGIPWNA
jgi:predicted nucleotidyltransferase